MKRIGLVVGVVFLSMALLLGQTGVGQMDQMGSMAPSSSSDTATLQAQIQILKAFNRADLSTAQLQSLKGVLNDLQAADKALEQSQQELHRFLVNWQGDPANLDAALQPHEQRLSEAQQAHHEAHFAAIDDVKGIFTIRQGEVLMQALGSSNKMGDMPMMSGSGGGMMGMMGPTPGAAQDGPEAQTDSSQSMSPVREHMNAKMASKNGSASEKPMPMMGMMADQAFQGKSSMMDQMMKNCLLMSRAMKNMVSSQAEAPRVTQIGSLIIKKLDLWATVVDDKLAAISN